MNLPPPGICLPARWVRTIDGDTIVVDLAGRTVHVRLLDCWAAELELTAGRDAKHALDELLEETADQPLHVWFPPPRDTSGDGILSVTELLRSMTSFGRFLGRVWAGSIDISDWMVAHGHAFPSRADLDRARLDAAQSAQALDDEP